MKLVTLATGLLILLAFTPVQTAHAGPGARVGHTDDPDTLFVGLHWRADIAQLGPGRLNVRPGVDIGLALDDGVNFMMKGAAHFAWEIPVSSKFTAYPLIGPAITYLNFDGIGDDNGETDFGVDLGGGLKWSKYAAELWLGIDDQGVNPDVSLVFAFTL